MTLPPITIALAQIDVHAGRPDINEKRIIKEIIDADKRGVDVIVFPEMCLSGYLIGDRFEDEGFVIDVMRCTERIVLATSKPNIIVVFGSVAVEFGEPGEDGRLRKYNVAYVAQHGLLVRSASYQDFAIKTLQPNYRVFDDDRHFYSLRKYAMDCRVVVEDILKPFPVIVRGQKVNLGVILCEDMWDEDYSISPGRILVQNGADILLNLSASPWSWQKNAKRHRVVGSLINDTKTWFVYVNNVGVQNNGKNFVTFDGSSTVYDPNGNIVAYGLPYEDRVFDVELKEDLPIMTFFHGGDSDTRQLYQAVKNATGGYLKTLPDRYCQKVVIGLSGGVDSANSAALFVDLLGRDRVIGINMPYKGFNSQETRSDAAKVAENLRIEYHVISIDDMVDTTAETLGIREGTPDHRSIQARMRMEVLAGWSSKVAGIFTCNANKTELAFGYGTLNGDLRGNFAPWMDCLKREVYQLADHFNKVLFAREVIPQSTITRLPMDELSVAGSREDPFDYGWLSQRGYHDEMVRAFVSFRRNPEWFLEHYREGTLEHELMLEEGHLKRLFKTPKAFIEDLERHHILFSGMVWKRIQSVPGALVDKRSFGFDFRESILDPFVTERFKELKKQLLR